MPERHTHFPFPLLLDTSSRNTNHCARIGYGFEDNRICTDIYVITDCDAAENFRSRSDDDVIAECRVTFPCIFAGAAERYTLEERYIIADFRCFTDNHAESMIDEKPAAYRRCRVNLDAGYKPRQPHDTVRDYRDMQSVEDV